MFLHVHVHEFILCFFFPCPGSVELRGPAAEGGWGGYALPGEGGSPCPQPEGVCCSRWVHRGRRHQRSRGTLSWYVCMYMYHILCSIIIHCRHPLRSVQFFDSNLRHLSEHNYFFGSAYFNWNIHVYIATCNIVIPSIESIYRASDLDVKLSCFLHLHVYIRTYLLFWCLWSQRQPFYIPYTF